MATPQFPENQARDSGSRFGSRRSSRAMTGERRVITILFCDVTGSTAMAEQLDPEEWAEIIDEAFDYLVKPVLRYGGHVDRLMGDAVLALFGAPAAHEDDPQRAIMAGLAIVQGIDPFRERIRRDYGMDFNVRVGINTGLVVVGEVGTDQAFEYTAMGDAVNLAARMEQTARPGTVQISGHTHRLVAPLFEFESLRGIQVKGKSKPVPAFRVLGRKVEPGRLRGIDGLSSPLVGRDPEWDQLRQALARLREGHGQIVFLVGEAGLGKSRLIEELRSEWTAAGSSEGGWFESRGVSYDSERAYGLFLQQLGTVCGVEANDPPAVVREKVADQMRSLAPEEYETVMRAVDVLLVASQDAGTVRLEGEAVKRELFDAAFSFWRNAAANAPLVQVFDDLHWADPASADLLVHLLRLVDEAPVLLICALRPYRQSAGWQVREAAHTGFAHRFTELWLDPLDQKNTEMLIGSHLPLLETPANLHQLILRKSEGNPFFVEEVIRSLIDGRFLVRDNGRLRWRANPDIDNISIPGSLQALLVARIDRLEADVRHTLQLASVIGRHFYRRVLEAIDDRAAALDRQLDILEQVEIIRLATLIPEAEYMFRHELTRDAAYGSILRRHRREFHRRVGEAIESLFPEQLETEAHRLAYHFQEAGDRERALRYFTLAGDRAARLYAHSEATGHYGRAIGLARAGDDDGQLSYLYSRYGRILEEQGAYERALETYRELELLAGERGSRELELAALVAQVTIHSTYTAGYDPERAQELGERSLSLAEELGDHRAEAKTYWNKMLLANFAGDAADQAQAYGERAVTIGRQYDLKEELAFALHDLARPYAALGKVDEARKSLAEAGELFRELGNMPMLADNLATAASGYSFMGEFHQAISHLTEALGISQQVGSLWGQAYSLSTLASVYAELGRIDEALTAWEEAIRLAERANFAGPPVYSRAQMALIHAELGSLQHAYQLVEESFQAAEDLETGLRYIPLTALAFCHLNSGKLREAIVALDEPKRMVALQKADLSATFSTLYLQGEVELALGNAEGALAWSDKALVTVLSSGLRVYAPQLLHLKGRALMALGRGDEAREILNRARQEAEAIDARLRLWPILVSLSELEAGQGSRASARRLREQAREAAQYLADHIRSSELRDAFLTSIKKGNEH